VRTIRARGAALKATEQPIDTSTAAGKCFLDMLGVFAEFETNLRRERQLEGIAKAKAEGKYKGRPPTIDPADVLRLKNEGLGPSKIAKQLKIGRASGRRSQRSTHRARIGKSHTALPLPQRTTVAPFSRYRPIRVDRRQTDDIRAVRKIGHDIGITWAAVGHCRWRTASMAVRWTAAAMLEAKKGFRKLKAYKQLPALRMALQSSPREGINQRHSCSTSQSCVA
jgi:hypothetical protein